MKELRIPLDDADYNKLIKEKGKMTWKELLLEIIKKRGDKQ